MVNGRDLNQGGIKREEGTICPDNPKRTNVEEGMQNMVSNFQEHNKVCAERENVEVGLL